MPGALHRAWLDRSYTMPSNNSQEANALVASLSCIQADINALASAHTETMQRLREWAKAIERRVHNLEAVSK